MSSVRMAPGTRHCAGPERSGSSERTSALPVLNAAHSIGNHDRVPVSQQPSRKNPIMHCSEINLGRGSCELLFEPFDCRFILCKHQCSLASLNIGEGQRT